MFRSIRTWPFPEAPAKEQPMQVMRSFAVALGVAVLGLACVGRARAQGNVLFPGSTVQGDILRGQGVAARGAAVLHLNAARARSIDADTAMRFNEYIYHSYQEYLRQRALRIAGKTAGRKASLEEIERRLREAPTDSDISGGDALNIVLVDLADPGIPATVREAAKVPLPKGAARTIPFQYATIGGILALGRLDVGDVWPVALRYQTLERPRRAYQQAVARLLEQCRSHQLTPEAVEAVGAAARELGSRAEAVIPQSSPAYRQVARQFTGSLERSARALTRTTYVEDLLGELDGFRGATIGDLVDLMRRYNLHFGPTEAPEELGLYQALYPLLVEQRRVLGLGASRTVGPHEARPTSPSSPKVGRQAVAPRLEGVWSRVMDGRTHPDTHLLPGGFLEDREGPHRWTFDGRTLVLTWGDARLTAVVSADGRSYVGTYKCGVKVWGQKLSDDDAQPFVRRVASGPVKVGGDEAWHLLKIAALQAWLGQDAQLAVTCRRAFESARDINDRATAERMAKICCLRPTQDPARLESARALGRKAVDLGKGQSELPWCQLTLGMAEYRNGHFPEADAALLAAANGATSVPPPSIPRVVGTAAFYRAMSLFRQGKEKEAIELMTEAASKMKPLPKDEKQPVTGDSVHDDLILWMAYKEARALIEREPAPAATGQPGR
jgi:hypothetical protein